MANHKSALKRHRQSEKRTARNVHVKSTIKGRVRVVRDSVVAKDGKSKEVLKAAIRELDKAVTKGVVHRRTASRKVARLTKLVDAAK